MRYHIIKDVVLLIWAVIILVHFFGCGRTPLVLEEDPYDKVGVEWLVAHYGDPDQTALRIVDDKQYKVYFYMFKESGTYVDYVFYTYKGVVFDWFAIDMDYHKGAR